MDVTFSDEQELLRKSAREFLTERCPPDLIHAVAAGKAEDRIDDLWRRMAELGWMGLGIPESYGGAGSSLLDVALLAEEMGRALVPAPWFSTVCLAGEAIAATGTEEQKAKWLPKIAAGELRATVAIAEPDARPGADGIGARASAVKGSFRLDGTKAFVTDLPAADHVVVAALLDDEPALFILDGQELSAGKEPSLDSTRPVGTLELSGMEVSSDRLLGDGPCGWTTIESTLDRAAAVLSAEMCGGSEKMLDDSVAYAKQRHQFGRPIGSFQGVSHRCAEMLLEIEGARSLTYYAAWCADEDPESAGLAASSAKAAAGDAFRSCTAQAIQIHGGIGFTWEAGLHFWYRRAFGSASLLGDAAYHRERVAELLGP
ncbi:MAG: acyl-CoA dehydrogenase family protein [Actinomycetota bacterium]